MRPWRDRVAKARCIPSRNSSCCEVVLDAAADVMTLGLWEVGGMPPGTAWDGREVNVEVIYDARDVVQEVHVIEGADIIRPKPRFARQPKVTRSGGDGTRSF